ncbi:MAG TPA: alginate lyase family protein, partial [Terriglobales bacterium]|nr:alginate lyase family protein [Terriglobales bacterium]
HWIEAMEPALRVLTWLWALPLLADAPRFTPALAASILRALVAQTRHVAANLSLYTSPNTHLICEALALFVAGTVLPELEAARGWREQGQAILEREIVLQVGDDGVYREASLYYHAYAVEFYLLAAVVAERNGVALAPVVRARLERMFEALAWLARPDGSLPNLGDGDGGRALRLGAPSLARVTELLASGAVLCGRGELRSGPTPTGEEAAWLWPDGASRVERFGWVAPPRGARHFADARLAVERRRRDGDERVLLFDAGDLGMLTGGHGHAGCLGLELYAQGRPLIVDRGTYVYNCAPAWRRYFRGTRAHSTVLIDDAEQAETAGEFRWATRYRSRIVRHVSTADYTVVTGEHDAYRRLGDPVRHRRTLLSVGGEYWVCVDQLDGVATHAAEFLFQLAPGLDVELLGGTAVAMPEAGDGVTIASAGFGDAERRVITGASAADDTLQGWHSDDYGVKEPAATLSTREIVRLPAVRVHVLAPTPRAAAPLAVESRRLGDGLAVTIRHRGLTDLIFCSPGGPRRFTVDGGEFTGELLHARLEAHGAVRRYCAVTARTFRWQGELRLESEGIADWVVGDASGPDGVSAAPGARLVVPVARNARARARATLATSERG